MKAPEKSFGMLSTNSRYEKDIHAGLVDTLQANLEDETDESVKSRVKSTGGKLSDTAAASAAADAAAAADAVEIGKKPRQRKMPQRGGRRSAGLSAAKNKKINDNLGALQQAIYNQQHNFANVPGGAGPRGPTASGKNANKGRGGPRTENPNSAEVTADMVQSLLSQLPAETFQPNFGAFPETDAAASDAALGPPKMSPTQMPSTPGKLSPLDERNFASSNNNNSTNSGSNNIEGFRPIPHPVSALDVFRSQYPVTSQLSMGANAAHIASFPQIPEDTPFADIAKQTRLDPPRAPSPAFRGSMRLAPSSLPAGLTSPMSSKKRPRDGVPDTAAMAFNSTQASYGRHGLLHTQGQQPQSGGDRASNDKTSPASLSNLASGHRNEASRAFNAYDPAQDMNIMTMHYLERQGSTQSQPASGGASSTSSSGDSSRRQSVPSNLSVFQPSSRPSLIRREKKRRAIPIGAGARAVKNPPDVDFPIGLPQPLIASLMDGGEPLNALEHQKLLDTTTLLQSMGVHVLEPLTLYTQRELYEVMGSIAEVWKNSGKAAMKKKINKIRSNARKRKAPRNVLDAAELKQIQLLQTQIKERENWEATQRKLLKEESDIGGKVSSSSSIASKAGSEDSM